MAVLRSQAMQPPSATLRLREDCALDLEARDVLASPGAVSVVQFTKYEKPSSCSVNASRVRNEPEVQFTHAVSQLTSLLNHSFDDIPQHDIAAIRHVRRPTRPVTEARDGILRESTEGPCVCWASRPWHVQ